MIDIATIADLIPNILNYLSYEYHIIFYKYLDEDKKTILYNQRNYIFCQLLQTNIIDFNYILNLKKILSPNIKFNNFFHETKLNFLLVKNKRLHNIK